MTATRRTTPDPRTEPAWLAGLPLAALQSLRDVVAENITDAARLAARGELEDTDDVAGELACLAAIAAEVIRRRPPGQCAGQDVPGALGERTLHDPDD